MAAKMLMSLAMAGLAGWIGLAADPLAEECLTEETSSLLQRSKAGKSKLVLEKGKAPRSIGDPSAIAGKSVYFVPVDRFAKEGGGSDTPVCETDNDWCGGTLKGLTERLDYIHGMGFDCVWITPVVKQWPGKSPSGTGCMGYWAYNIYEVDPHFGTEADLKNFISELHKRDMCIVYDFVGNHMGPIHNEAMVAEMVPFNKSEYFNQLFIGDMTFNEYTNKTTDWPPPAQAMWSQSGAQCTKGKSCSCYKCVEQPGELGTVGGKLSNGCKGTMEHDDSSPCPKGALSPYCMPGDYACEGYSTEVTQRGWFYDLGDLNQSNAFVRKTQLDWIHWWVEKYDIDVLRLDTAPFMAFDFLSELQASAGVPILGEVTTTNDTFHANFQADPPGSAHAVLDGVLNFPIYYTAFAGFCGQWFPYATWNLTFLGVRMEEQQAAPYKDLDLLGNFMDNHDTPRMAEACKGDVSRISNAVAFYSLYKGVPITYYGTEQLFSVQRKSFWQTGYKTDTYMYQFLKAVNSVRKEYGVGTGSIKVVPSNSELGSELIFTRGNAEKDAVVWVYLNNLADEEKKVKYCAKNGARPEATAGKALVDAISGKRATFTDDGCFVAEDRFPKVVVEVAEEQAALLDIAAAGSVVRRPRRPAASAQAALETLAE